MWLTAVVLLANSTNLSPAGKLVAYDAASKAASSSVATSQICVGHDRDLINIYVLRPATIYRISPDKNMIRKYGDLLQVLRKSPIWKKASHSLCGRNNITTHLPPDSFAPRIVIEVDGAGQHSQISLEYPTPEQEPRSLVSARFGSDYIKILSYEVRYLLDYAIVKHRADDEK